MWSLDMTKCIYHLIGHKFSQFEALSGHFCEQTIENYLVPFKFQGHLSTK